MKAIILAAGKGTRMLPLTEDTPKVMVEVAGKPFLYYLLETLKQAGITEFGIIMGYMYSKIREFLAEYSCWADVIFQNVQRGTGDAVLKAQYSARNQEFIVISGDNLYHPDDIKALIDLPSGNYCSCIHNDTPEKYGVLEVSSNKIVNLVEKPEQPQSNLINAALYRFTPEIFDALEQIELSPRGEIELSDAINVLANQGKMNVHHLTQFWQDFGCPNDIPLMAERIKSLNF